MIETLDERIERGLKDGTIRELKMEREEEPSYSMLQKHVELLEEYKAFTPTHSNWWTRSTLRRLLRIAIGLHDDVRKGEIFENLIIWNITNLTHLVEGLRQDLDAATKVQNPVNAKVVDIEERLTYYEHHTDALKTAHRRLMNLRVDAAIKREREVNKAKREAVKHELKSHAQFGELVDCSDCNLEDPDCKTCGGLGVVLNPECVPPTEEINGDNSQAEGIVNRSLRLVGETERLDERNGSGPVSEEALPQGSGPDAPG